MKTIFLILLFANLFSTAFCQDYSARLNIDNSRDFNQHINNAELAIIDSAYNEAIKEFDSAEYHSPLFSHDRYNKAVCEALVGKNEECRQNLEYLLEKGLKDSIILENPVFQEFLRTKEGKDLDMEKIEPKYDFKLRAVYDSLFYEDQYLRLRIPYGDSIRKVDASNVAKMNSLIEEFGWPTDDLIGNHDFSEKAIAYIINHQRSPKTRVFDYSEYLYEAYAKGEIEVHEAAWMISLAEMSDNFKINDAGIVTVLLDSLGTYKGENLEDFIYVSGFVKLLDERLSLFNSNRLEFGLESIENFRKKLLYFSRDKRFRISQRGWHSIYCFSTIEDYKYASGNIILPL